MATAQDWELAALEAVHRGGLAAVSVEPLARELGVTKGSFYWHFTDIAGYRATLIQAWGELRDDDRSHFTDMSGIGPRERLSQMMSSLLSARHWTLERAMREWARTDDAVAASVRAADQRVLDAVRQAFVDHGFDADDADLRANATFAAGIGFLHLSGQTPNARGLARRERFLDLMLSR
jgi:AcrR family transcriptional regulator